MAAKPRGKCFYCGVELVPGATPGITQFANAGTWDHVWPISKGGKVKVPCCWRCNTTKSGKLPGKDVVLRAIQIGKRFKPKQLIALGLMEGK